MPRLFGKTLKGMLLDKPAGDVRAYRGPVYAKYTSVSNLSRPLASKYQSLKYNLSKHLLAKQCNGPVLDIGAGQGEFLELCRDLGLKAEGVDISNELVSACTSRGLKVRRIDNPHDFLRAEETSWGLVSMIDVLEHFTKDEAFEILALVQKRLLPRGKLILQFPNMQSPFATLNLYHDITHEWAYTEFSITQLLKTVGFERVSIYPCDFPPMGLSIIRRVLRYLLYAVWRTILVIDQPNRGRILTPNLIVVAGK